MEIITYNLKNMKRLLYTIFFAALSLTSCNYLDVEPVGKVIPDEVSEFRALLTSAYSIFPKHKPLLSVRSDEMIPYAMGLSFNEYLNIALWDDSNSDPATPIYPWITMYKVIFYTNSVIADVMNATIDTDADTREQLLSEAYLLRAYAHFELANLYAAPYQSATAATEKGIPLQLKIDIDQEFTRGTLDKVYQQILTDIDAGLACAKIESQSLEHKYRFSRQGALALKARVLTYMGDWQGALETAETLIPSLTLEDLNASDAVQPNATDSKESIVALEMPINTVIIDDMNMSTDFMESVFDTHKEGELFSDQRLNKCFRYSSWSGYVTTKAKDRNGRVTFRAGEIYLIAAEAAAHLNEQAKAVKYLAALNTMRLTPTFYTDKLAALNKMSVQDLVVEVARERARELAAEGHRWYDLRRTTRPRIVKTFTDDNFTERTGTLEENDSRYVIAIPKEAIASNPELMR